MNKDDEEEYIDEIYLGDNLYRVEPKQMQDVPHRHIGALICKSKYNFEKIVKGTGLLISPNLVLTCTHNLITKENMKENYDFRFYPGHQGILDLNAGYKVQSIYYPQGYLHKFNSVKFEYALLKLIDQIKDSSFIPLRSIQHQSSVKKIAIFGYPGNFKNNYTPQNKKEDRFEVFQFGLEKMQGINNINLEIGRMEHWITTYPGQSGAPIIAADKSSDGKERLSVVAIHKGGTKNLNNQSVLINVGKSLTRDIIKELKDKAIQWKAEMFTIYEDLFKVDRPKINQKALQWVKMLNNYEERMQNKSVYKVLPEEIDQLPHKLIGMVNFSDKGRGTGILLSPNLVLTSAFNVYDKWGEKEWKNVSFSLWVTHQKTHKKYQVQAFYFNREYPNDLSTKYQYALLKLKVSINLKKFIPLKAEASLDVLNQKMAIIGFSSPNNDLKEENCQIGKFGKNMTFQTRNNNEEIVHKLQTVIAMGGGPILSIDKNGGIVVVGIHKGGLQKEDQPGRLYKCGRLLTTELIDQLRREAQRMEADPFLISRT